MKKLKFWLTGLLLIQLLLAVALIWSNQWEARQNQPKPLLTIDWQGIDKLTIQDKDSDITLVKSDRQWMISEQNLPASDDSIDELLRNLQRQQTGWPVATTRNSHKRFEVAEDKFVRRIQLYSSDKLLGELFLGSSPGLRQAHARRTGDDSIYTVELDTLEILPSSNQWFDKSLIAAKGISSIRGPDYNIKKTGLTWGFNRSGPSIFLGNTQQGRLNQEHVDELATALAKLVVLKIASTTPDVSSPDTEKIKLMVSDDKNSWTYHFIKFGGNYYVSRSDREELFSVEQSVYEKIADVRQDGLIVVKPKASSAPTEDAVKSTNG